MKKRNTCDIEAWAKELRVGEEILLSGTVYTARDAVHKKFAQLIAEGKEKRAFYDSCLRAHQREMTLDVSSLDELENKYAALEKLLAK